MKQEPKDKWIHVRVDSETHAAIFDRFKHKGGVSTALRKYIKRLIGRTSSTIKE